MAYKLDRIYLAPMEGVADAPMRKVLTHYGAWDACTSEFIRVTTEVLPYKTILRDVPEVKENARTAWGCPCRVQLLGDEPEPVAKTALRAVEVGAQAIDLNFGCPSRFVHHGGSMLLKEPELLHRIVSRVREVLDPSIHLSVKFRIGFADAAELPEIVRALAVDGVDELIMHARTRKDLYKKEALNWPAIGSVLELCNNIPVVANGDILSYETSQECARITGTDRQMVGRALFAIPNIPQVLRGEEQPCSMQHVITVASELGQELQSRNYPEKSVMDRLKQFLGYAQKYNAAWTSFFRIFCRSQSIFEAQQLLEKFSASLDVTSATESDELSAAQAALERIIPAAAVGASPAEQAAAVAAAAPAAAAASAAAAVGTAGAAGDISARELNELCPEGCTGQRAAAAEPQAPAAAPSAADTGAGGRKVTSLERSLIFGL